MTEYEFLKLAVRLRCAYIEYDNDTRDMFDCVREVFKGWEDVRTRMLEFSLNDEIRNKKIADGTYFADLYEQKNK